jgi:uncharacterized protein DUF992
MKMNRGLIAAAASVVAAGLMTAVPASAQDSGVKVGYLTCNVTSGWGFVFGSSRDVKCEYSGAPNSTERYSGSITKFGVDIGYLSSAVMVWAVFAPTANVAPGTLGGQYAGGTASAAAGLGVGVNGLVGGSGHHISLQPVSIEGQTGLNVAGGIAALNLTAEK